MVRSRRGCRPPTVDGAALARLEAGGAAAPAVPPPPAPVPVWNVYALRPLTAVDACAGSAATLLLPRTDLAASWDTVLCRTLP